MTIFFLALGGSLGALCRYLTTIFFSRITDRFPYGTLLVNMFGTFLLGWLVGHHPNEIWMIFLGTGFCGALTTFSTLQWEILQFQQQKKRKSQWIYIIGTYSLGILIGTIGYLV